MHFIKTDIEGVYIVEPRVFEDARGYFFESYSKAKFEAAGLHYDFIQDNQSMSTKGVLRGLHTQKDHPQGKLVRVIRGKVFDVAVELSAENKRQLMIPRGFAHGFSVLSETAVFAYKCDNLYCKEAEGGLCFDDPALGIDWRIDMSKALTSEKDRLYKPFAEFETCF